MIYGTILVCALKIASCTPDTAYKSVLLPQPMPTLQLCYIALQQLAATNLVPVGSLMLYCSSRGYVKLNSVPV